MTSKSQILKAVTNWGIAFVLFAAGSVFAKQLGQTGGVSADNNRVFELRVYHVLPGKLPVMESRFREKTSKLLAKHHLNVVGYWTSEDSSTSGKLFIFILAHRSREEAKTNWDALVHDPEFQQIESAERTERTLEKADLTFMRPTDFSPMK